MIRIQTHLENESKNDLFLFLFFFKNSSILDIGRHIIYYKYIHTCMCNAQIMYKNMTRNQIESKICF